MIKIGVADYGCNVWYGGIYDYEERLKDLKAIGYEGIERLVAKTPEEAMERMADAKKLEMDFVTCRTDNPMYNIRFAAAFGMKYI